MKNRKKRLLQTTLCSLSLLSLSLPLYNGQASAQTTQSGFTVDLGNQYRPVTHVASGSLYGLADEKSISSNLITPIKPLTFTQMAPNGQQMPAGDALKVAGVAEKAGA
jgi:hypothetical protein